MYTLIFWIRFPSLLTSEKILFLVQFAEIYLKKYSSWPKLWCRNDSFCTQIKRRWDSSVPVLQRSLHTPVCHTIIKCTCFYSTWDGTCNPRCLPGLDSPVDSLFLGGGGVSENIKGTGNLTGISCIKQKKASAEFFVQPVCLCLFW